MPSGATFSHPDKTEEFPQPLLLAFAPIHKSALGVACGLVCGLLLFLAVAILLLKGGAVVGPNLSLLSHYFPGFSVDWLGSVVAFLWASAVGFVLGWVVAFLRNMFLAMYIFLIKTRAEIAQYGDFLDHI